MAGTASLQERVDVGRIDEHVFGRLCEFLVPCIVVEDNVDPDDVMGVCCWYDRGGGHNDGWCWQVVGDVRLVATVVAMGVDPGQTRQDKRAGGNTGVGVLSGERLQNVGYSNKWYIATVGSYTATSRFVNRTLTPFVPHTANPTTGALS